MIEITVLVLDPESPNALSGIGAWFDIAGALVLARALVWVKSGGILEQSTTYWSANHTLIKMFCEQKVDASFGLGFLIAGFLLQFAASLGLKSTSVSVSVVGFGGLLLLLIVYSTCRVALTEQLFKRECRMLKSENGTRQFQDDHIDKMWTWVK